MRPWRKLHSSILDSSQAGELSDGAFCLFTMLIAAQDDSGFYPLDATKMQRLKAVRPRWSVKKLKTFLKELCKVGLARMEDDGILLTGGDRLNGKPRRSTPTELYPRRIHDESPSTSVQHENNMDSTSVCEKAVPDKEIDIEEERKKLIIKKESSRVENGTRSSGDPEWLGVLRALAPPDGRRDGPLVRWAAGRDPTALLAAVRELARNGGSQDVRADFKALVEAKEERHEAPADRRPAAGRNGSALDRERERLAEAERRRRAEAPAQVPGVQ